MNPTCCSFNVLRACSRFILWHVRGELREVAKLGLINCNKIVVTIISYLHMRLKNPTPKRFIP
ncbi:hypothetical protein VIBNIAM115_790090 [Vibrio nigripulchritudo AM115]|nr:hypothetical protein VIBNIAM115_790090 [Vibrio nigripulchritudo AM115]